MMSGNPIDKPSPAFCAAVITTALKHQPIAVRAIFDVIPREYCAEWKDETVRTILEDAGFAPTFVRKGAIGWAEWSRP